MISREIPSRKAHTTAGTRNDVGNETSASAKRSAEGLVVAAACRVFSGNLPSVLHGPLKIILFHRFEKLVFWDTLSLTCISAGPVRWFVTKISLQPVCDKAN